MSQAKSVLVRHKIVPPGLPAAAISRPRLTQMYADLLEEHEALAVFAAAGSGKTVQAQLFALTEKWPIAWLTLDRGDHSTSRMLSYLAAALDAHVPTASKVLESAFGGTSIVEEAAAILAEAIDVPRLLVVIDHCEAIADAEQSCSALETFLDYLPAGVRTMLLSRSELQFSLGRLLLHGRVGRIVDEDLALTLDEAKELVEARHEDEADLSDRWEAARGWIAGVAFGGPRRPGGHDRARDFSSYLSSEVIGGLTADERRFMIDTSILDAVSQRAATALCGASSRSVWRSVGMRHLPATTSTDRVIVYHPCLRKYLREQLELEDPARMEMLQQRYAALLLDQHQYEEAVELLLSLGMRAEAADAAAKACRTVTERGDWETFLRWVDEIGPELVDGRPLLLGQLIKSLRGARRLPEARALARQLDSSGRLPEVLEADPGVIAHVAWSMLFQPAEGLSFLDRYDAGRRAAGVRYMLEVTSSDEPVLPPWGVPWTDTDRLISWALMVQGRLDDLVAMLPSGDEWPPRTPYSTPHPLFGLIWRGELARARELYEQVPLTARCRNFPDLWLYLEAWLLLAEGDAASALDAAERAVAHSRQTGFGFESVFEIVQGSALVALGRPADAVGVLTEALEESERTGVVAYQEWAHTGIGRAQLELREDESARQHLRIAVEGMQRSNRLLMLPLAAVYLSEAEWRLGDTERADAAAAVALDASVQMKAFPALQVALSHFPSVYRRQLERAPDAEWRRVGSTTRAPVVVNRTEYSGAVIAVDVHPFGPNPDIYVGGEPANVRRLKVLELAAYLAARPGGVPRHDVQAHLFPESDRRKGSNHFRQVVHQLRRSTTLTLQRLPNSLISWSAGFSVDATDLRFGRALVQARALTGEERLDRLRGALDLVDGGYLIASDLGWVSDRRFEFEVLQEEAELEVARLALDFGQYDLARETAEALLARNPYSDVAYRALIETELAVGSEAAALAVYRRSVAALAELGLAPDQDMARLLQRSTA